MVGAKACGDLVSVFYGSKLPADVSRFIYRMNGVEINKTLNPKTSTDGPPYPTALIPEESGLGWESVVGNGNVNVASQSDVEPNQQPEIHDKNFVVEP